MKDILYYKQLFAQFEALNASAYQAYLKGDFEEFEGIIEDFISSGIMEQEQFPIARESYRYASMPFTLNGFYIGTDDNSNFLENVIERMAWTISDIKQRDVYPIYAYLTEQEKQERAENKLTEKRIAALDEYVTLYKNLYNENTKTSIFGIPLIDNVKQHQMFYIDKVVELATARSKFHLSHDFTCSSIDNELLASMTTPEKMEYLTKKFANIFSDDVGKNKVRIEDYFSYSNDDKKILISNYIQGKRIDRKNWKNYTKGIFPNNPLFYLELAFYLSIPSSDEIEKFMNLHGYSIKGPITHFYDIPFGTKKYHILHRDLCRWIDAGIDYNLINEMCGMELEVKEQRK